MCPCECHTLLNGSNTVPIIGCRLARALAFERGLDTLIWQLFASVALPGFIIHTVVHVAHLLTMGLSTTAAFAAVLGSMGDASAFTEFIVKSIPTFVGLLSE